ncbi:MAG: AAA family ATPase [Tannerella sp.]|jgi:hypothetical protein|nr:AAA family ATPase [Tannerella sp.]
MDTFRKLPVGVQDFEKLRSEEYIYVDKTAWLYRLAQTSRQYFLERPRRFGKSLFLSTLGAYFRGKKELFDGLAIAELEQDWTEHPVFYLDMNVEACTDVESLYSALNSNLEPLESVWGKIAAEDTPAARFYGLIRRAHEKTGRRVVVLVDEYDKPLLGTMDNPKEYDEVRKILAGFYCTLKSADASLRFVMLTGVTRFPNASVFSDLNHLTDISLDTDYAGVCGISQTELTATFLPELESLAKKCRFTRKATLAELEKRCGGYHFARKSENIHNPFSLLNTFDKMDFRNYWFATGTPTFLVKILRQVDFDVKTLEKEVKIQEEAINDYRIEHGDPIPLLYQSGYLTITDYDARLNMYTLGFPNEDVKYSFFNGLLPRKR